MIQAVSKQDASLSCYQAKNWAIKVSSLQQAETMVPQLRVKQRNLA